MQKKWTDGIVAVGKRHRWAAPLLIALLAVLFGAAAVAKWCGELPARLRSGAGRRILASALAVCMVFILLPTNAFAAEGNLPNGLACHTVHDKDCGYSETYKAGGCTHEHDGECGYDEGSEGAPCTYTPNEGETEPHEHNDDCGYKAAVPGKNCTHEHDSGECGYAETVTVTSPCTHKCALCEGNNSIKPEQPEECVCTAPCTEEAVDAGCPVCSGEKAGLSLCKGKAEVVPDATSEAAQAVIDLIDALPSADEIYNSAVGDSDPGYADWLVDTQETLRGAQAAQAAFDALDDEDRAAVGELRTDKLAELVKLSAMLTQLQPQSDVPVPAVGFGRIYANGAPLLLVAGTPETNTVIYIDRNKDGIKNEGDTIFTEGLAGKDENGNDLSSHTIYGGSDTAELTGDTKITMLGGKVGDIYGGGYAGGPNTNATVTGSTSVTVNGGTVSNSVYGGGYAGDNATANVGVSTSVTIDGTATVGENVYGGGYVSGDNATANVGGSTSVTVNDGTVGSVYGGGYADGGGDHTVANVSGSTNVTVNDGTVGSVYGGGNVSADVTVGSRNITIGGGAKVGNGGSYGVVINGGSVANGVDSFAIDPDLTGDASVSVVLPGGYTTGTIATGAVQGDLARIKLIGSGAEDKEAYFDGGEIKVREPLPTPTVDGQAIYANGAPLLLEAGTPETNTVIYIDRNKDGIKNEGDTIFTEGLAGKDENGNDLSGYTIYGGSGNKTFTGDTKITMLGGKVKNIYGGGYAGGNEANATVTGSTSVTVNGGTVGSVYGGGYAGGGEANATVTGSTSVTVNGGTVGSVYGGGYAGSGYTNVTVSGSTSVTVNGGTVSNSVYGGGYAGSGYTNVTVSGSTSVTVNGGTVSNSVYGGGYASGGYATNATVTNTASIKITGTATVEQFVYGGGNGSGDVTVGSRNITIGGGAKVGNGSRYGVVINGGSVANGVDSFAIDPDLTGDASVSVVLPGGYTTGTIATGAVDGDLARIKLIGSGAEDKEAYFDSNAIKVGPPPSTVTNVAVSPITVKVTKGTTQQFDATVTGTNGPMQSVTWAIEGSHDSDTSISQSGLLTVAANETQKTLTVKATSTADTTKSGTATVTVIDREVTRYTLTVTDGNGSGEYAEGAQITITAQTKTGKRFNNWTATGMTLDNAAANPITITMPARAVTLTAKYEDILAGNYTITFNVNGGNALTTSTAQTGADGRLQRLPVPTRSGSYRFDGWFTAEAGGTAVTTATVFTQNSTIYAHWTYTGGSGSSDGGGGSSSSNNNSSVVTTEPSKPTPDNPNPPTTGTVEPAVTVDKNSTVKVEVSDKDIQNAIDNALTQAKKDGAQSNGIAVAIDMTGLQTQFNTLPLTLSKTAYDKLVKAGVKSLDIRTAQISLSLDLATLQTIHAAANGNVTINAVKADPADLPGELSGRPAYNLTITSGGKAISSFGGYVAITLPYALQEGEQGGNLQMAYVGTDGKLNTITDSSYNTDAKAMIGRTNHFTVFGIMSRPAPAFSDIENHWAKDDILFVASRGLLSGTGNNQFSPNTAMTRGMFVTALGRLAGVNPDSYKTGKFTDVKADAYYAPYVNWAADKGIVSGTTDTTFAPDANISREQMAVMMANYAKTMGYTVLKTREAVTFADNGSIGGLAKDAVTAMQMAGVVNGKDGNRFDPTGTATRGEVAAVLHRYVELVIDWQTAQGLDINDSGSAMMWESGRLVKSQSRTVNGSTYAFNGYGEAALPFDGKRYLTHVVKRNEHFWSISRLYGCRQEDIMALNGLKMGDVIHPGDVLKVPQK